MLGQEIGHVNSDIFGVFVNHSTVVFEYSLIQLFKSQFNRNLVP